MKPVILSLLASIELAVNGAANPKINMEVKPVEYSVGTAKSSSNTLERSVLSGVNLLEGLDVTERSLTDETTRYSIYCSGLISSTLFIGPSPRMCKLNMTWIVTKMPVKHLYVIAPVPLTSRTKIANLTIPFSSFNDKVIRILEHKFMDKQGPKFEKQDCPFTVIEHLGGGRTEHVVRGEYYNYWICSR